MINAPRSRWDSSNDAPLQPIDSTLPDLPFLVVITWFVTLCLWRRRVGRSAGALLLAAYLVYIVLHVFLG
jgi:Ca2+/Na+ antiporter